jgi:hypothetical protein
MIQCKRESDYNVDNKESCDKLGSLARHVREHLFHDNKIEYVCLGYGQALRNGRLSQKDRNKMKRITNQSCR